MKYEKITDILNTNNNFIAFALWSMTHKDVEIHRKDKSVKYKGRRIQALELAEIWWEIQKAKKIN